MPQVTTTIAAAVVLSSLLTWAVAGNVHAEMAPSHGQPPNTWSARAAAKGTPGTTMLVDDPRAAARMQPRARSTDRMKAVFVDKAQAAPSVVVLGDGDVGTHKHRYRAKPSTALVADKAVGPPRVIVLGDRSTAFDREYNKHHGSSHNPDFRSGLKMPAAAPGGGMCSAKQAGVCTVRQPAEEHKTTSQKKLKDSIPSPAAPRGATLVVIALAAMSLLA